jgi:ubiquinone/menaquinone biosynthesis C-methylase UbiE
MNPQTDQRETSVPDELPNGDRFWQRHARRYDRATLMLNRRFPDMAAFVTQDLRGSDLVLEVAAGTGLVTVPLARAVRALVATDLSDDMLQILRRRIALETLTNVSVQQTSAEELPFVEQHFDAIVAANLLHLLPAPGQVLNELRRVLKVGGTLCVPTFEHGATALAHVTSRLLRLAGFPVTTRFRGAQLRQLVEAHGFRVSREATFEGILPLRYIAAIRMT